MRNLLGLVLAASAASFVYLDSSLKLGAMRPLLALFAAVAAMHNVHVIGWLIDEARADRPQGQ